MFKKIKEKVPYAEVEAQSCTTDCVTYKNVATDKKPDIVGGPAITFCGCLEIVDSTSPSGWTFW